MSYNSWMVPILAAFGLTDRSKLPVVGASRRVVNGVTHWVSGSRRVVDGVTYWINALPLGPVRHKRSTHRLMCECPHCGKTLSAGRLAQHLPVHDDTAPHTMDREDFHSDEGRSSVDDEPNFPEA